MTTGNVLLFAAAFLACAVEMVEALTIVLAVGVTRDWRSTLIGVGVAALALAVIVAALGPALTLIPIETLRLIVGALLLVFGLQWLRKAILRAGGYKAMHDEAAIFERESEEARRRSGGDPGRARLVRVHRRIQGSAARGARGRLHRGHVREQPGQTCRWRRPRRWRRS